MLWQRKARETVQAEEGHITSLGSQNRLTGGVEDEELSFLEVKVSELNRGTGWGRLVTRYNKQGNYVTQIQGASFTLWFMYRQCPPGVL